MNNPKFRLDEVYVPDAGFGGNTSLTPVIESAFKIEYKNQDTSGCKCQHDNGSGGGGCRYQCKRHPEFD